MKELTGKVAIVTSSTRGIGLASARKLAGSGAKVWLAVRRPEAGQEIAREIAAAGGMADTVYFDAAQPETFARMVSEVEACDGRIDILVNNFGTTDTAVDLDVAGTGAESFLRIVGINLRSVYEPSSEVLKVMIRNGGGSIVNISSVGGVLPDVTRTAYGVAKAAINFLTRQIAVQYAASGVRCNAVLPGLTATDAAMDNMPEDFRAAFLHNVPLARIGSTEDIAEAVLFLASDRSSYITGELLPVAGGFGLPTPMYSLCEPVKH